MTSFSMNSIVVATAGSRMIFGTSVSASFSVVNGINSEVIARGFGSSFIVIFVTTASVPSEPTIRSFKE